MSETKKDRLPGFLSDFLEQLRSSYLVMLLSALWLLDMMIPDPIPFVDEIVLGLVTLLVARWTGRSRRRGTSPEPPAGRVPPASGSASDKPPIKNVTPSS